MTSCITRCVMKGGQKKGVSLQTDASPTRNVSRSRVFSLFGKKTPPVLDLGPSSAPSSPAKAPIEAQKRSNSFQFRIEVQCPSCGKSLKSVLSSSCEVCGWTYLGGEDNKPKKKVINESLHKNESMEQYVIRTSAQAGSSPPSRKKKKERDVKKILFEGTESGETLEDEEKQMKKSKKKKKKHSMTIGELDKQSESPEPKKKKSDKKKKGKRVLKKSESKDKVRRLTKQIEAVNSTEELREAPMPSRLIVDSVSTTSRIKENLIEKSTILPPEEDRDEGDREIDEERTAAHVLPEDEEKDEIEDEEESSSSAVEKKDDVYGDNRDKPLKHEGEVDSLEEICLDPQRAEILNLIEPNFTGLVEGIREYVLEIGALKEGVFEESHARLCAGRYLKWLVMKKKHEALKQHLFMTPDVFFVYRVHLRTPILYYNTCIRLFGKVCDFAEETQVSSFEETETLWRQEYNEFFEFTGETNKRYHNNKKNLTAFPQDTLTTTAK